MIPGLGLGSFESEFLHIVKAKISAIEFFLSILLMAVCSFLLSGAVYYDVSENRLVLAVLALITGLTSFNTLVNESAKEMAVYINDNFAVGLYSTQYMRVQYVVIVLLWRLISEAEENKTAA